MNTAQKSLRLLVDKWLAPTPTTSIRITRLGRRSSNSQRCIRVETVRSHGPCALFFFRHRDGTWRVFPPGIERPAMNAYNQAP
ncbi:hypothetical protein B0G71_7586 [Paraburkholderia sp. BL27I4N3]|nr:hypothetical protein B0G71_7586 [Paraburkholderia sp. BL27I4N3]